MCINPNRLKYLEKLPLRSSFVKRNNIIPRNKRIDLEHYFKYYLPEFDAGYKLAEQYCELAEHPLRCWDKHHIINRFNKKYNVKGIAYVIIGTVKKSKKFVNIPVIKNSIPKSFIFSYLSTKIVDEIIVIKNINTPCIENPK